MKIPVIIASAISIAISTITYGTLVYDIDFNSYVPGTSYTNASGPPNDFSTFSTGGYYSVSVAHIEASFLGLTNNTLVTQNTNVSTAASYGMTIADATSHVITLQMQLSLGTAVGEGAYSGPNASISFSSDLEPPNQTMLGINFGSNGDEVDNVPISINSLHGLIYLPTNDYSGSGIYNRNTPHALKFIVNTYTHVFSVSLDDIFLTTDAPFYGGQELKNVSIAFGDMITTGAMGYGAIDNVTLDVAIAPESITNQFRFVEASFASGTPVLSITNPSPTETVYIQRCNDLMNTNWLTVTNFLQSQTNWTDTTITDVWGKIFYRLTR